MKKVCLSLALLFLLIWCAGCSSSRESAATPPSRIGTEKVEVSELYTAAFSMEDAWRDAAAVARVRVGSWLGGTEDREDLHFTYFEASAIKTYKGDLPETFVLVQYGDTKVTWKDYPLYTDGDELLVFLTPYEFYDDPGNISRENTYRILGDFLTVLNAAFDKDGNVYYIDSCGTMGDFTDLPRQNGDDAVFNAVRADLTERDPLLAESAFLYPFYVYSEADVEQLFARLEA